MAMFIKKTRSAMIVVLASLLICGLSSAGWTFQQPERPPASRDERRRTLERLTRQIREAGSAPEQSAAPAANPAPPVAASPQAPIPPPAPPAPTPVQPPAASMQGGVQLNFENQDLVDFINQITSTIGLAPVIIDPEVKGTVNLHSGPMSREDILPLFNLILKNNNAALIYQGGSYQILPISAALKRGVEIIERLPLSPSDDQGQTTSPAPAKAKPSAGKPAATPTSMTQPPAKSGLAQPQSLKGGKESSRLATHIIRTEFIPVKDLIEPVKLFMTEGAPDILAYDRLNMMIVTDYTDNVARILEIVRMLDNSYLDPDLVELVKINNNAAEDVTEDLQKMFGAGTKDSATGINFIPLERLNAIFVMASSKRALEEVKGWIKELDSSSAKKIQAYVYTVENGTASNIAMMLSALYGGEDFSGSTSGGAGNAGNVGGAAGGGGPFGGGRNAQGQAGMNVGSGGGGLASSPYSQAGYQGGAFGGGYNQGFGGGFGGGAFGAGRQLGPQLNTNRTVTSQVLRGGSFTGLQDTVRMVVDDINNSLIIQATAADYAYISETIRKMDILPRQVLIDAKIYEVDLNNNLEFGIAASLQKKGDNQLTTGSFNLDAEGAIRGGVIAAQTFFPVGSAREIMAALAARQIKGKVRILEAPSVLALDGQQASIIVGDEIPYPGTSFTPSVGGTTTSVQYRDTGISLLVLPRISASGFVTMDIYQEVSAPGASYAIGDGEAQGFSKSSVQTTLTVKDGETVAFAGLIRDKDSVGRSGIPFLSEIPLMGSLFGNTTKETRRSELIVMITPHVIRTPEAMQERTMELRDSLRNVRKYADEKEEQHAKDMENAREDRYEQNQKSLNKIKAAKPAANPPAPVENKAAEPVPTAAPGANGEEKK